MVSFDEVAHHDYDVMSLLDAQSDVEGIDVTLFTGQVGAHAHFSPRK